jgi:hypothetical protein
LLKNLSESLLNRRLKHFQVRTSRCMGKDLNVAIPFILAFDKGVRNSTFIHLRAKGPNIYMYKRGRIYKDPPGEIQ